MSLSCGCVSVLLSTDLVGMGCMPASDGSLSMEGGGGGTPPSSAASAIQLARAEAQQRERDDGSRLKVNQAGQTAEEAKMATVTQWC